MKLALRSAVVGGWTLGSRVLGLVRDRLLAGAFGGSLLLDAFLLAFALPNLLRNLFGEGALSAAFLPRYVQLRDKGDDAEGFAGLVITRLAILLSVIATVGMVAAGAVLLLSENQDTYYVAALALPQLPYLIFICTAAIMAGVLNGRRHFAIPAAAPVILNAVLIGAILIWRDVWILPYAVLVTGMLQLAVHVIALRGTGGVPPMQVKTDDRLREMRRAFLPVLLATGVYQLNALLDSVFAYILVPGAGAVAYLYFANRLFQFPLALVGHGVATAAYPEIASAAGRGWADTGDAVRSASGLIAALLLPATLGLWLVAEPLAGTVYQVGNFTDEGLARCVLATQMFALAIVPVALAKLFVRALHAHRDQRTPLRIGIMTVVLNLALNVTLLLTTELGEAGLALATAVSAWVSCLCYVVIIARRGGGRMLALSQLLRPIIGTVAMGFAVWLTLRAMDGDGSGIAYHGPRLAAAFGVGMVSYGVIAGGLALRALRRRRIRSE